MNNTLYTITLSGELDNLVSDNIHVSSSSWIPISAIYPYDENIKLKNEFVNWTDGYTGFKHDALKNGIDYSINRETVFYLPSAKSFFDFVQEVSLRDSYLGAYVVLSINTDSVFSPSRQYVTVKDNNLFLNSTSSSNSFFRFIINNDGTFSLFNGNGTYVTVDDTTPFNLTLQSELAENEYYKQRFNWCEYNNQIFFSTKTKNPAKVGSDYEERFWSYSKVGPERGRVRACGVAPSDDYIVENKYTFDVAGFIILYTPTGLIQDHTWVHYYNEYNDKQNNKNVEINEQKSVFGVYINHLLDLPYNTKINTSNSSMSINFMNLKNIMTENYEYKQIIPPYITSTTPIPVTTTTPIPVTTTTPIPVTTTTPIPVTTTTPIPVTTTTTTTLVPIVTTYTWNAVNSLYGLAMRGITISEDGQRQTIVRAATPILYTKDKWSSFIYRRYARSWVDICGSSNGKYQTAIDSDGIYRTDNYAENIPDYGESHPGNIFKSVYMSDNGIYQIAVAFNGKIWVSISSGEPGSWLEKGFIAKWTGVCIAGNGSMAVAVASGSQIQKSTDYGETWTAIGSAMPWSAIAISYDGQHQTAVIGKAAGGSDYGNIYISHDYGTNWHMSSSSLVSGAKDWRSVTMTDNGQIQFAVANNETDKIYESQDYGESWYLSNIIPGTRGINWKSIRVTGNGRYAGACAEDYNLYIAEAELT